MNKWVIYIWGKNPVCKCINQKNEDVNLLIYNCKQPNIQLNTNIETNSRCAQKLLLFKNVHFPQLSAFLKKYF